MLEVYVEYLAKKAFEEHDINEKFLFEDIIDENDLIYLTEEGKEKLRQTFFDRIDKNLDGILKLHDSSVKGDVLFKKVARKPENTNYFASKVY